MKKAFVNGMILIAIVMSLGITAFAQRILGGYKTASTSDERVVAAAEFAVGQKAEEQEGLTLDSIEKAETQTVAGTNYRLCLKVSLEDETQEVKAVVFQNLKQEYSLTSWVVEDCAESESSESNNTGAIKEEVGFSSWLINRGANSAPDVAGLNYTGQEVKFGFWILTSESGL